jgi:hypothetical protein
MITIRIREGPSPLDGPGTGRRIAQDENCTAWKRETIVRVADELGLITALNIDL